MAYKRFTVLLLMLLISALAVVAVSAQTDLPQRSQTEPVGTLSDEEILSPLETLDAELNATATQKAVNATLTATYDPCYIDPNSELIPYCTWTPTPTNTATPTPKPTEEKLPLEGLYAYRFEPRTQSGDCSDYRGGDNDGPSRDYSAEDPMFQASLCKWTEKGIVLLNSDTYHWDGSSYVTDTRIDAYDNSTSSKVMSVIDASHVDVIISSQTGTCTNTWVIHYELVQPGKMFGCYTNIPTQEPEATAVPDEEQPTEEPPVVEEGHYVIKWLPFGQFCEPSLAPTFTETALGTNGKDTIRLYVNGEVVELSGEFLRGQYSMYGDTLNVNMSRRFPKDFLVDWMTTSDDKSKSCFAQGIMTWTAELSEDEKTALGSTGNNGSAPSVNAGSYSATWNVIPGSCSKELESKLPNFSDAAVSVNNDSIVITADGTTYTLENMGGVYFYFGQDGDEGVMFSVNSMDGNEISTTYGTIVGEKACYAEVVLQRN